MEIVRAMKAANPFFLEGPGAAGGMGGCERTAVGSKKNEAFYNRPRISGQAGKGK